MNEIDHLAVLVDLQSQFQSRLVEADPSASVPSCGDWTVAELAEHLGEVHVWAAGMCRGEPEAAVGGSRKDMAARYACRAHLLRTTLEELPLTQKCATLAGEGTVSFWHRRQIHETLIHLWDLCSATDPQTPGIDAEVWADCIDEVVTVLHPRQVRMGRAAIPAAQLRLEASDVDQEWLIGGAKPSEQVPCVTAPASVLALMLWGRQSVETLTIRGERSVIEAVLAEPLTP